MTRNELYKEIYFSKELKKASEYLLREFPDHKSIAQDLLSDTILEVFKKSDDELFDLNLRNKLKSYIFLSMRNVIYQGSSSKVFRNYGLNEARSDIFTSDTYDGNHKSGFYKKENFLNGGISDPTEDESIEITKEERAYSEQLFGCTTKLNVQFMREIEKADNNKSGNLEAWETAQITKLYFEFRSFRKVAKATGIGYQQVRNHVNKFISSINIKRMNVVVVTGKSEPASGMELYRLHYPYFDGIAQNHSDDINIKRMTYDYIAETPTGALEDDVYVFSRLADINIASKVIEAGKKLVIDIDDYWNLSIEHPLKNTVKNQDYVSNITKTLPMAHLVTCTTPTLWEKLHDELNITATIIKNTIPEQSQFSTETFEHSKIRFGWVGGLYHTEDLRQVQEGVAKVYTDIQLRNKFQICLAGYNPNQFYHDYEKILTNEYKGFSTDTDYVDYLKQQTPQLSHIAYNKSYRRIWMQNVSNYGQVYKEIDVCLIPLKGKQDNGKYNDFTSCKSELKLIEAGYCNKAAIVSDVMPYHPHLKHEENCLVVSEKSLNWYSQIRRLTIDKELRQEIADNLTKYVKKEFSHKNETNKLFNAIRKLK